LPLSKTVLAGLEVAEMGQAVENAQYFLCKLLIKKGLTVATNLLLDTLLSSERGKKQ
jgi:hypothetical protein